MPSIAAVFGEGPLYVQLFSCDMQTQRRFVPNPDGWLMHQNSLDTSLALWQRALP